jgi:GTP-binding protein Era
MADTKSAMITICGRPNVGKSTLTNALVGEKIAIVSSKPQTTRNRICGIVNRGDTQLVLLDTPGLHRPKSRLDDYMAKVVKDSMSDVDCIMMLVEPIANVGGPEKELIERIRAHGAPAVLVINKMDRVKREELLAVMAEYSKAYGFTDIVPVSARRGDNLDELEKVLEKFAKNGPHLFPDDATTDQPDRQVVAEMVREKMLECLSCEVPHGIAVEVDKFSERDNGIIDASVTIYCEKTSHKGIIIGRDGAMLKKISTLAREDIEKFMGTKVYLETWVKVRENWRDDANFVKSFGYTDE